MTKRKAKQFKKHSAYIVAYSYHNHTNVEAFTNKKAAKNRAAELAQRDYYKNVQIGKFTPELKADPAPVVYTEV